MGIPINLNTISDEELRREIRALPAKTAYSGRAFFLEVLKELGREDLSSFLARVNDMPEDLDLELHFSEEERAIFKKIIVQFWDRRKFLQTFGWGLAGGVAMAAGAAGTGEQVESILTGQPLLHEKPDSSVFARTAEFIHKVPGPPTEFLIGAALVQEGHDKWDEIKLEEIADAVELLVKRLRSNPAFMREIASEDKGAEALQP